MTPAFVESGVAAALKSLDRALDEEAAMDREVQRHLLVAYEQLRACEQIIETERRIAGCEARAKHVPSPLRVVR